MSKFYICWCGNSENNHNFRHKFEGNIPVEFKDNTFILDATKFPLKTRSNCGVSNCRASKELHDGKMIEHEYQPIITEYRHVMFCLPPDTTCLWKSKQDYERQTKGTTCGKTLQDHDGVMTHHFVTSVIIKNKTDCDKIDILDPEDEDTKIIWL